MTVRTRLAHLRAALMPGRQTDEPWRPETARVWVPFNTVAGEHINADTALKSATVWACVTYLSRTVAQLPWRVMRETSKGALRVPAHPVEYLIHQRPNPEMSSFSFRETMTGWAVRRGNAVAEIQRDNRNVPIALWPIHPSRVCFERDNDTGELLYGVTGTAIGKVHLRAPDVFHVRGYGEGPVGLDVMSYAAESLGWSQATQMFGAAYFGNGTNAGGFIETKVGMTPAAKTQLDKEIEAKHGGARKAHKNVLLDADMKYVKASDTPEAAQFIKTREHQVEEVCRWFGVPPHKVMHMLHATFSNIEHQSIEVVVDSITPWALRYEQEADYKFFGQNRQGVFTKLDMKGLLRGDFKTRQEGLALQRRNGVINGNEWRRLEDMEEIGPDGDKYIVEANMTTLEAVGSQPVAAQSTPGASQVPADPQQVDPQVDEPAIARARRQAERALLH